MPKYSKNKNICTCDTRESSLVVSVAFEKAPASCFIPCNDVTWTAVSCVIIFSRNYKNTSQKHDVLIFIA